MERNFCDKCGKEIFKNRFSNKLNRVCFIKDSYRSGDEYKEDEVQTFELCDICYNLCFDFIKNCNEGDYMSRMIYSIRNNTIIDSKHIVDDY